jgi:hypothetical protein
MSNLAKWILEAIKGCDYDCADWDEDVQQGLAEYIARYVYDHMTGEGR